MKRKSVKCAQNGKTTVDVAVLQEQMNRIQNNDLVHLAADIKEVKTDVKDFSDRFERRFDALDRKVARFAGGITVIILLAEYLIKIIFGK